jgi:predicted NAD/FAD-binding protein
VGDGVTRRRVAVIGSGVSGLTAGYVLRGSHDVTLFEADDRLGGHADTHDIVDPAAGVLPVDTGFIVHNARTYPTLLRLFDELGVATQETDMSMSVSCAGCGLEYSGGQGLSGILAQNSWVRRPRFVRMLAEVRRFHRHARAVLDEPAGELSAAQAWRPDVPGAELAGSANDVTMRRFLADGHYSVYFVRHFITPLIAAVWSSGPATALDYPARYLFAFLDNHGMLSVGGSPQWRTVVGGSRSYVERAVKELTAVYTRTPIRTVTRRASEGFVELRTEHDEVARFDAVVVATHPGQALRLLSDPTAAERSVLGAFRYAENPAVLHTDPTVLPRAPRARASWNYRMAGCADGASQVRVSYDMTRLQHLPGSRRYLVSLNQADDVRDDLVLARMDYAHPQYSPESVSAQSLLPSLNDGVTAFAGAYHGWGFHEDGARSGVAAAISLGGTW